MEIIKAANKVIRDGLALLPKEMKEDFRAQANPEIFIDEAISNACGAVNENAEKIAMLKAYAVQEANRVASTLWRFNLITPELEKAYRELPSQQEMADQYNAFLDDRKARTDKIMADNKVIMDEKKEMDIFMGVVNGISAKESESKYNEYMKRQQAAMGR